MENTPKEKQQGQLDELRLLLAKGELSCEEVSDILELEIYAELEQHEQQVDHAWLNACSEMMEEMDAQRVATLPDHAKQNWEAISSAMGKRKARFPWKQIAVAAACIAIVLGGISFSASWYQGTQMDEGQVYGLTGQKVEISNGQQATAAGEGTLQELETENYADAAAFLGMNPPVPHWWPEGWEVEIYYATLSNNYWDICIFYLAPENDVTLSYMCAYAADPSTVSVSFPQDGVGKNIVLENGENVYFSTNAGETIAIWQRNNQYMFISGPVSMDNIIQMIYSIYEGDQS